MTAAAPVAVGGGRWRRWRRRGRGRRGEGRVRRHPRGRRRQEDPGHQGGPRAHEPRPEGGQGPRRRRPEARRSRRPPRKTPRRPRPSSKSPAPRSSSSRHRADRSGAGAGKSSGKSLPPGGFGLILHRTSGTGRASGRCRCRGDWQPAWRLAMLAYPCLPARALRSSWPLPTRARSPGLPCVSAFRCTARSTGSQFSISAV